MNTKSKVLNLDQFKEKHYGVKGSEKRDALDAGYENFKIGSMIHDARLEKGLTQEELADKVGTTKILNTFLKLRIMSKEVRLSTLMKIVELGLGGQLQLNIKLK